MSYYDIQSEAPTVPATRSNKAALTSAQAPTFHNLTAAAWAVLFFAVCSVLFIVAELPSGYDARAGQWKIALPHLAIVACLALGNRRFGQLVAVLVGIPFGLLALVVSGLSGLGDDHRDGPIGMAFAMLQLAMILFVAYDAKRSAGVQSNPIKLRQRLLGLALPVGLLILAFSVNQHLLNNVRR